MSPAPFQFLRLLFIGIGTAYLIAVSFAQFVFFKVFIGQDINAVNAPYMWWHDYIMTVLLILMGAVLALRLSKPSYHIFLAAFLVFFGITYTLYRLLIWAEMEALVVEAIFSGITGSLFIYSMMRFAGRHTAAEYGQYYLRKRRPGWYKRAVIYFSNDKPFWLVFFPLLTLLIIGSGYTSPVLQYLISIAILVVGLVYFRLSFYFAGSENRNRLGWLLWGLIVTIFMYIVHLFLGVFYRDLVILRLVFMLLNSFLICFSFCMSIFFFRSTDARFVVRKTLIYGAILIAGLFLFGAVEHYLIHTIAHALHIQSSILNSCFGAAIALMIRPLHHKVEHWLSSRGKPGVASTSAKH